MFPLCCLQFAEFSIEQAIAASWQNRWNAPRSNPNSAKQIREKVFPFLAAQILLFSV